MNRSVFLLVVFSMLLFCIHAVYAQNVSEVWAAPGTNDNLIYIKLSKGALPAANHGLAAQARDSQYAETTKVAANNITPFTNVKGMYRFTLYVADDTPCITGTGYLYLSL